MSYRIIKHFNGVRCLGFVVEVKKQKWYGKEYWTHFISVAGIESKPWYYNNYKNAQDGLIFKVTCDTVKNSKKVMDLSEDC